MILQFNITTPALRGLVNTTSSQGITPDIYVASVLGSMLILTCCACILCSCKKAC